MTVNWVSFADIIFSGFILFYLIGQRFNQWPEESESQFSGQPYDYIDIKRYLTYFFLYILTFVALGTVLVSANFMIPKDVKLNPIYEGIVGNLGNSSLTAITLFLLAFINDNHLKKLDSKWRNCLQKWARIPRAVEDLRENIIGNKDSLRPIQSRLEKIQDEMKTIGVDEYWSPRIENWKTEYDELSINWLYLKAIYALHVCKELRISTLNQMDIDRYEKRLHDLARVIVSLNKNNQNFLEYNEELIKIFRNLTESLCKHVIKRNSSKNKRYDVLQNFGFYPSYHDSSEIKISSIVTNCILFIAIITFISIYLYLNALDYFGFKFRPNERWATSERLFGWFKGSFVSYSIAIFMAIFIEKTTSEEQAQLRFPIYIKTILISTLGSLAFFWFGKKVTLDNLQWSAFFWLSMTFSVSSVAVIKSFRNESAETMQDVLKSSLNYALMIGLVTGLFQVFAAIAFRKGLANIQLLAMVITFIYGLVKGASVVFIISFVIQESIRRQLIVAQRESPRRKLKTRISAIMEGNEHKVTTQDISKGGVRIEPGKPFSTGQVVELRFKFGAVKAKVQWVSKKAAGLAFIKEEPDLEELYAFVRNRLHIAAIGSGI